MKREKNKKLYFIVGAIILLGFCLWFGLKWPIFVAKGGQDNNVRGWAWSENIGWLSTNCYNDYDNDGQWENCCYGGTDCPAGITPAGVDYGLTYKPDSASLDANTFSGLAWSENIGWLCFGETCSGTTPDNETPWACVGKRIEMLDGTFKCFKDCGEEFNVPGQPSCTTKGGSEDANLVAHWKFNNEDSEITAIDSSANNNDGTLNGGPIWYAGKWNKALKFDGLDDYVSINGSFNDITQTQEAWIRLEDTPTTKYRITSRSACGNGRLHINADRKVVWEFGNSTNCDSLISNTILEIEKWYHLAGTFDNSDNQAKIYINGQLDNTKTISIEPIVSSTLTIGSFNGTSDFFNGLIDNVAIYSRVKSAEEIWDDAHIEISGWAKVESLGDEGWIKLKGQTTSGDWYGFSLDNWADTYYTLDGYGWNANAGSAAGIGWLKGGYYYSGSPIDQDNFSLSTDSSYCYDGTKTQMFLSWSPALWAEAYFIERCNNVDACPGCVYTPVGTVFSDVCELGECSYQDSGLDENTGYCWKVIASNSQGETEVTPSPLWGKTPLCAPLTSINDDVCGIIKLLCDIESGAIGYNIYRSQTSGGCVTGSSETDDSAADIRARVKDGTCQLIGHLGESLDYRGIVGHWTMDESSWNGTAGEVRDSSGQENHGTANCNGETCTLGDGLFSYAGSFDGVDDYLDMGDRDSLDFGIEDFILKAWVNLNSLSGHAGYLISKGDLDTTGYRFFYNSDEGGGTLTFQMVDAEGEIFQVNGTVDISDSSWHHIACVIDRDEVNNCKIYVDGRDDTNSTSGADALTAANGSLNNNSDFRIASNASGGELASGLIDNVSIYKRVIESAEEAEEIAEEIKIDYEAGRCEKVSDSSTYCAVGKTCSQVTCGDLTEICNTDNCGIEGKCCYIDRRIIPGTDYYYRVTSFTKDGGESSPGTQQSASTLCYPPTEIQER